LWKWLINVGELLYNCWFWFVGDIALRNKTKKN